MDKAIIWKKIRNLCAAGELHESLAGQPLQVLVDELVWYIEQQDYMRISMNSALNAGCKLFKAGGWTKPRGMA